MFNKGDSYENVLPVIQIGLLDFTLFPDFPEFYARYRMMHQNSYYLYSDKIQINVLDLTHIDLATKEDKAHHLDYWASLFKAKTWEDLKDLAEKNELLKDAVSTVYTLSEDERIWRECRAKQEYLHREKVWKETDEKYAQAKAALEQALAEKEQVFSEKEQLSSENEQLSSENEQLSSENEQLRSLAAELKKQIANLQKNLN